MNVTNQNQEIDDGLKLTENDDGSFTLEWDPCDTRWSVLNGLTSEQISAMIMEQVKHYLEEHDDQ